MVRCAGRHLTSLLSWCLWITCFMLINDILSVAAGTPDIFRSTLSYNIPSHKQSTEAWWRRVYGERFQQESSYETDDVRPHLLCRYEKLLRWFSIFRSRTEWKLVHVYSSYLSSTLMGRPTGHVNRFLDDRLGKNIVRWCFFPIGHRPAVLFARDRTFRRKCETSFIPRAFVGQEQSVSRPRVQCPTQHNVCRGCHLIRCDFPGQSTRGRHDP